MKDFNLDIEDVVYEHWKQIIYYLNSPTELVTGTCEKYLDMYILAVDLGTIGDQFRKKIKHIYLMWILRNACLTYVGAS